MPDLKFYWDEGLDRAARVEAVLAEIKRDEAHDQDDEESGS
jgi:ribosome-binding factor A